MYSHSVASKPPNVPCGKAVLLWVHTILATLIVEESESNTSLRSN